MAVPDPRRAFLEFESALDTAFEGGVAQLMAPGETRPFALPWFEPIATSARDSGMPMGGIGGAFTLTPAGTTPVLSFLPGHHVTVVDGPPVRLHNFFFCEREPPRVENLYVDPNCAYVFGRRNEFYPLRDPAGHAWFRADLTLQEAHERIRAMVAAPSLFTDNRERLLRWQVPLSPRTRRELELRPGTALANIYLLLDFYGNSLVLKDRCCVNLTADLEERTICGWDTYPAKFMRYRALYPRSETLYHDPDHQTHVLKHCYTALVPGDLGSCELPVSFTEFRLYNPGPRAMEISLVQVVENLCGSHVIKQRPGLQDGWCRLVRTARYHENLGIERRTAGGSLTGVLLGQRRGSEGGDLRGHMFAGIWLENGDTDTCVTVNPAFAADREQQVIAEGTNSGTLSPALDKSLYTGREGLSGALCATRTLAPGESSRITFVLGIDFPEIQLPGHVARKAYVQRFPEEQRVVEMTLSACGGREQALARIEQLHEHTARSPGLDWLYPASCAAQRRRFVTLLTNLLAFYADAASTDTRGDFLVRECADYPFFNVLDVYFYGVFSLQPLLPAVDRVVLCRYAQAVLAEDPALRRFGHYTEEPFADLPDPWLEGPRAVRGAVPHDLGSTFDCRPDAYVWRNVKEWKDLAPKYALLVLRSFEQNADLAFLRECAPAVYAAMDFLSAMREGEHPIPLARGGDDTFDTLSSYGITVYCGSLWIAGLRAAARIALLLGEEERASGWSALAAGAQRAFVSALWDEGEGYYHFYATPLTTSDVKPEAQAALPGLIARLGGADADMRQCLPWLNRFLDADASDAVAPDLWTLARDWTARHSPQGLIHWDGAAAPTRRQMRARKKLLLAALAPDAWAPSFHAKLPRDSDDILCAQLLADTWLDLLDLEPITPVARRQRVLRRILARNFRAHSPTVGAANLVDRDGGTHESYQAQDVWLGVQFALAAALVAADMPAEAREIIDLAWMNLYERAKIPFASPEGFNGNSPLRVEDLASGLSLDHSLAEGLQRNLRVAGVLDAGFRVLALPAADPTRIARALAGLAPLAAEPALASRLGELLRSWTLRYTASRYHRPGMAHCVLEMLRKRQAHGGPGPDNPS